MDEDLPSREMSSQRMTDITWLSFSSTDAEYLQGMDE
jgi:hypothetical protein